MTQTIKNRLLKDIELVKTLDLPVMSASAYYKTLLLTLGQFCLVFLFCEFCMSLAYCLMGIHRWGKAEGRDKGERLRGEAEGRGGRGVVFGRDSHGLKRRPDRRPATVPHPGAVPIAAPGTAPPQARTPLQSGTPYL